MHLMATQGPFVTFHFGLKCITWYNEKELESVEITRMKFWLYYFI
jgi:hypothetical protein